MDSPSSSPKVTRAARTYGRRRQTEPSEAETSFAASLTDASPSLTNVSPTNSALMEDVPPSSDDYGLGDASYNDDDESHGEAAQPDLDDDMDDVPASRIFARRSLKDDLAMIDEQFDQEDMDIVAPVQREPEDREDDGLLAKGDASGHTPDDPFIEPNTKPTALSHTTQSASPSPSPAPRRLAKRTRYTNDSDSEAPAERVLQTSPHTSPSALHPINTPTKHSSPTPPTSQEMSQTRAKGKGKGKQRSRSSEDEESDDLPAAASEKVQRKARGTRKTREKRMKAPTKKELLETQKATARIKADQRPALPRNERKLKITSLFEKLSNNLKGRLQGEVPVEDSTALPSDPIQPFSSSPHRPLGPTFVARPSSLRPQPSRATSSTKDKSREFVPSGLLGGNEDEPGSSPKHHRSTSNVLRDAFQSNGLLGGDIPPPAESSDEDEAMPDIRQLLEADQRKREQVEAHKRLQAAKLQYIEKRVHTDGDADDSDLEVVFDDMHAVADEEEKDRRAKKAKHLTESVGRQKQLTHAGKASLIRSPTKAAPLRGGKKDIQVLTAAAVPSFSMDAHSKARKGKGRESSRVNPNELNKLLLHASEKQSRELTEQKEAEFYKKLGQRRDEAPTVGKEDALEMLVQRGLESRARDASSDGDDEDQDDDEGNDGDWTPASERVIEDDEDLGLSDGPHELPIATDDDGDLPGEDDENDENIQIKNHRTVARRAVIDSDDDEENRSPVRGRVLVPGSSTILQPGPRGGPLLQALIHRGSMSSMDDRPEEGTDKENDASLMFDRGEDKENTAVASQSLSTVVSPLAPMRGGSGIFSLASSSRRASSSSTGLADTTVRAEDRVPLKELPTGDDDDDDIFLSPSTKLSLARSPHSKSPLPSQSLSPLQLRGSSGKGKGLSEFFEDDEGVERGANMAAGPSFSLEPAADIRGGGLSQFFAASAKGSAITSPAPLQLSKPGGFSQFMTPLKAPDFMSPRKATTQDLALTLGPSLQPALEVDEKLMRQADDIFEKEQEYLVGDSLSGNAKGRQELFVNKHGFLTQTKPPSSPTSPAFTNIASSVTRQPLSTIALSRMTEDEDDDEEEEAPRPRRLMKRNATPDKRYRSSLSPSPVKARNAFDVLGRKPARIKAPQFDRKKLDKNEFIQGEAEESDEDAGFGFGLPKRKDEEEELDGEDQDRVLEELVDDAAMDVEMLNEEKVLEKVQEHRALDDAAEEKIARDAAEGKMRVKRRTNLLDFDDDDSDEEDWEVKRARERMAKKRRIEGDTLEEIEKNPHTRAFAAAYRVEDDENEFAHLGNEEATLFGIGGGGLHDDDEQDEEEDNDEREVVDAVSLREQLQRVARGEETVETIDVNDVAWLNASDEDMEDEVHIKEVAHRPPSIAQGTSNQMEWDLMQQRRPVNNSEDIARQQKWARSEGGSRNLGTGRASAVTSMNKSVKAGSGSSGQRKALGGSSSTLSSQAHGAKKLAKAPSALSAVSGRRARFG